MREDAERRTPRDERYPSTSNAVRPSAAGARRAPRSGVRAAPRSDFPLLANSPALHYLDSAATSQKPRAVLDAMRRYYETANANPHRGAYDLSVRATEAYHEARERVARFLGVADASCLIFTRGTTEALNLVASSWGRANVAAGEEIVVTAMEHHANFVPWQQLARERGARLRVCELTAEGRVDLDCLASLLGPRTRVVAFNHVSNALGTINPVQRIVARAREVGAVSIIDAAQAAPHLPLDVQDLGADFLGFTGHKLYGPSGVGVLWGRYELLAALPPFLGGGEMIETVAMEGSTFAPPPSRFEAGTPMIAQAVALGTAVDYVSGLGMQNIRAHEKELTGYALDGLQSVDGVRIIGPRDTVDRGATISFTVAGVHPHDVAQLLDERGIAVRAGHHCARPVCLRYGVPATTRASFGVYTTRDEIDALVEGVDAVRRIFA
jgi:cysteine desulfurase/selenocysteine lyase